MNYVDIIIFAIILLCGFLGFKKGVIKSLVQLIGFIVVIIISFVLKDYLANWLMGFMPFFNFAGFEGITSINILFYELVSFVVIFIVLYCILSIIISVSGIVEKILKFTVILAIPSKILGAIVGLIEGVVLAFLVTFILFHIGGTTTAVRDSQFGVALLESTPFVDTVTRETTRSLEEINDLIKQTKEGTDKKIINAQALQILIHYQIISKEDATKLIENKKLELENVTFAYEGGLGWLNI